MSSAGRNLAGHFAGNLADLTVAKLVATGNDFLFIDARQGLPGKFATVSRAHLAKRLCDRHLGAGADGLVFVEAAEKSGRFKWDFYNADGSAAEMCGNASRCMGRWAEWATGVKEIEFETVAGLIRAVVIEGEGGEIASYLDSLQIAVEPLHYRVTGEMKTAQLINTGVPHAVCTVHSLSSAKASLEDIRALRFHAELSSAGANVTFLEVLGPKHFSTVTFERGIEDFTLSCGTGVLAAAAVGLLASGAGDEAMVETPGGTVSVRFGKNRNGAILQGPARFLYRAEFGEGFLQ